METSIIPKQNQEITAKEAMAMNRHERRRLGKINGGIKIPGSNTDHIKPEDKPFALQTITGHKK